MGRTVVAEILAFSEEMLNMVSRNEPISEIKAQAVKEGFTSLKEQAIKKLLNGETSPDEISRVVG